VKRIQNSLINSLIGIITVIIEMITQLVLRREIMLAFGKSIYGLNSVISTVISILSLAELGVESVICFSLYKPIAQNNQKEIISIMQLYRKFYYKIAFLVLTLGMIFMPFLKYFTHEYKNNLNILYITYIIFLADSFLSYFFSYNKTFLIAMQKNFIINIIKNIYSISGTIFLILLLNFYKNYTMYLITWTIFRVLENFTSYIFVNKKYTFLNSKKIYAILPEKKNEIVKNIKALIMHKIGAIFVLNTDSLIISRVLDLGSAGLYLNYTLIIGGVHKMASQVFNGIRASFGDFAAEKEIKEIKNMFYILQFIAFVIYSWCSVFILNICQPFISLWMGTDKQLNNSILYALIINFYLRGFRFPIDLLKDVKGVYRQDRYKSIFEAIVKLLFSIILANYFGYLGVILGTIISFVSVLLTVEPYIVYKYILKEKTTSYYFSYIRYFLIGLLICFSSVYLNNALFNFKNLYLLIFIKFTFCLTFIPVCFIIFFYKTYEFNYLKNRFIFMLRKNKSGENLE